MVMDLREAEKIKKIWKEYTEELYKKDLQDPDNHDGVVIHLDPEILECEVKWDLGSITMKKASGGDGIAAELVQILKDDAVKVMHSICQQTWKTQQWPQDWKRSVFIPISKKSNAKEGSNYCTVALISQASKVMLKILQARLQQYVNPGCAEFAKSVIRSCRHPEVSHGGPGVHSSFLEVMKPELGLTAGRCRAQQIRGTSKRGPAPTGLCYELNVCSPTPPHPPHSYVEVLR